MFLHILQLHREVEMVAVGVGLVLLAVLVEAVVEVLMFLHPIMILLPRLLTKDVNRVRME